MAESRELHVAMFPWFAFGHMIPYLDLSKELAQRGHKVTFFLPKKALSKLQNLNSHPHDLITFHPLVVPPVDGLPPGTETVSDIPGSLICLLATAHDRCSDQLEAALRTLNPDFLFYDFAHWAPTLATQLGIKSVSYVVVSAAPIACMPIPSQVLEGGGGGDEGEDCRQLRDAPPPPLPPPGYPSSKVVLRPHEFRMMEFIYKPFGEGVTFQQRITTAFARCDAISLRTCHEIEGPICDYIGSRYGKPVFVAGPVLPKPSPESLEVRWAEWLGGFEPGSVIFCAFGSEHIMAKDQFQELLLGLELTGLPFLVAVRPPAGAETVEEALPKGFKERVGGGGRGVVHGGWVPQPSILKHPSVGCFVSHCGFGSMWESLSSDPQILLLPQIPDQILNARLLSEELKVAVEIQREENGWFSKESLCRAIKLVMDEDSEVGCLVKRNHAKFKETFTNPGFMSNYIDNFVQQLQKFLDDH